MEETNQPLVYKSPSDSQTPVVQKSWWKTNMPKLIYGLIILVIVIQLVWAVRTIINGRYTASAAPQIKNASFGSVVLSNPNTKQVLVNSTVTTNIRINTGGHGTDSTDLIIKFNPAVLEASPSSFFTSGNAYREYILTEVDNKTGTIRLIGATPPNTEGFVGIGNFGTLNFRAKAVGNSPLTVTLNKNSTAESNMVDTLSGNNILEQTFNTDVQVVNKLSAAASPASFEMTSCSGYTQYCYNMVGQIGSQFCSGGKVIDNACSFDPELTTTCTTCDVGL